MNNIFKTAKEIEQDNKTYKKVFFIGSGYEAVKTIIVKAETNKQAIDKAIEEYKANKWAFAYNEIEVARSL